MDRQQLRKQVELLRLQGKTIRAIADELGVPKSNVHRAVKGLMQSAADKTSGSFLFADETSFDPATAREFGKPGYRAPTLDRPFVGRIQEMAQLRSALENSIAGQPQLTMLVREPGIGKTRLTHEIASYAQSQGIPVLRGRCYENMGAPPYWPWVQAIVSYVRECEPERLRSEMGAGASDIAEIVPDLWTMIPGLEPSAKLEPDHARMRLFDSIVTFLSEASRLQSLVLVLDNLHWADVSSLLLLEFVSQELGDVRILTICTYRDTEVPPDHPLSRTLGELTKVPRFQRIHLSGLAQEDVGTLIEATSGMKPPQSLAEQVHRRTGGNPLFVTEVIKLLEPDLTTKTVSQLGTLPNLDEPWSVRIPDGLREEIGTRLSRMSDECNRVLTIASVVGREFDLELLKQLIPEMIVDRLLEALDEALAARIIEEIPEALGRYQFSHALIQETLRKRLSISRRVRLHAGIGETLETLYEDHLEAHSAELVFHFTEAEPVLGPQKLVNFSLLAGENALATYAFGEALSHFQRAVSAKEKQPEDAEMAAALFGLGRAQEATFGRQDLDLAFYSMSRAFDIYARTKDEAGAVRVAEFALVQSPWNKANVELIARALKLVSPDSPEAGRLLSRYVLVKGMGDGDYEGAEEALGSALAIAQRTGDLPLEMRTLAHSSRVDFWHLRWQGTIAKGLRVIELAGRAEDQLSEVHARFWVGIALLHEGESNEAQLHAKIVLATAESLRFHYFLSAALWLNERVAACEGDFQSAKDFNQQGLSVSPSDTRLIGTRMLLEYETGDKIEGDSYRESLVKALRPLTSEPKYDHGPVALLIPVVARISGELGQLHIAEGAAATVLSDVSATPLLSTLARLGLALTAVLR